MGYSTRFTGTLEFTCELTIPMLAKLQTLCGEEPSKFGYPREKTGYIDLEPTKDLKGLQWDDSEKTYYLETSVNIVIAEMRKDFPDFGLRGELLAQGEAIEDRWRLVMESAHHAVKVKIPITGAVIRCPHCREKFIKE